MWGTTLVVAAFILALIALSFAWGAPIVAVPIVLIGIVVLGTVDVRRRRRQVKQMHDFREQAKAESVDFTSRDKETLVSE